ncbi:MAG: dienelactone hydrolase family protein, partial [Chloroflexota bacterium]
HLEELAQTALSKGNIALAITLFHEAVACFHIGQHIFFIDAEQKETAQEKARKCYKKAIALYPQEKRPIRIEIPFDDTIIPGYLCLTAQPNRPLVIYVNGMDNIKEAENHFFGKAMTEVGLNFFMFDGPGQGEMWKHMKFRLDYEKVVSAIIDWFENNNPYQLNLQKIATVGFSLGGYLAPLAAAYDKRVCCTVGNSGFAAIGGLIGARKLNPIWQRGINYLTGCDNFEEAVRHFDLDITRAPHLDRPLLFFHAGKDEVMPSPKKQADTFMEWAIGEKELIFYPDGEHCTVNYLDEVFPYIIDWLRKQLFK